MRTPFRTWLASAAFLAGVSPHALAAEATDLAACRAGTTANPRVIHGLMTVRVVCDRVFIDLPPSLFGKDFLVATEFAAVSAIADAAVPGELISSNVVRWQKRGGHVVLERVQFEMRGGEGGDAGRGLQATPLGVVIRVFDPVAEQADGTVTVDVTPVFTTDLPAGFAQQHRARFRVAGIDPKRSYLVRADATPASVGIRYYQTWVPDARERLERPDEARDLGFLFSTHMRLLPDPPMQPRTWDERVGYYPVSYVDYGTAEHGGLQRAFIQRFRLEKRDPSAAVSEPVRPLVFYLAPDVPEKWRLYLKRAVEDWNVVFEAAGFHGALVARDAPSPDEDPGWEPDDPTLNVIRWVPGSRQNAVGPALVDPRTGEVLSAHLIFWHDILKLLETWYFTQAAPSDPRARTLPLPDALMGELLRYVATHELGHVLGLRHNFKAHSAYSVAQLRDPAWTHRWGTSASIMSYARFNYVAQPGDGAGLLPRFGPYDFFAVQWGYGDFGATPEAERPALDRLAARQIGEPMLRFGGEDDAAELDPDVNVQVLGADPVEAAGLGLLNLDRVAALLVPALGQPGRDYSRLAELHEALVLRRDEQLRAVAKLVGGIDEVRYQSGRGGIPFTPVAPDRQRRAARFLAARAFTEPRALTDRRLTGRIAASRSLDVLQGSNISLLSELLRLGVFARMAEASEAWPHQVPYEGLDLLRELNRALFSELSAPSPKISAYRRTLQRQYLLRLEVVAGTAPDPEDPRPPAGLPAAIGAAGATPGPMAAPLVERARAYRLAPAGGSEFRAALRAGLAELRTRIRSRAAAVRHPATRTHLHDLLAQLDRKP